MFLKNVKNQSGAHSSGLPFLTRKINKAAGLIVFYLFKDRVRLFVFLLVIDALAMFFVFNQFLLPVINQSDNNDPAPAVIKKVKIRKDLYNDLINSSVSRPF